MRIVVWNCQMAFRTKFPVIAALKPDLLVIAESESPERLVQRAVRLPWPHHLWIGDNPAKGLSVFASAAYQLRQKPDYDPAHRFVLPVGVRGPGEQFDLYAFWTQAGPSQSQSYVTQSLNALDHYGDALGPDAMLMGDFNSSPVFKVNGRKHLDLVARLEARGLTSVYHQLTGEDHGAETRASFFLHRNRAKPYHLDYIFCHGSQQISADRFQMGQPDDWLHLSDHMPLVLDL